MTATPCWTPREQIASEEHGLGLWHAQDPYSGFCDDLWCLDMDALFGTDFTACPAGNLYGDIAPTFCSSSLVVQASFVDESPCPVLPVATAEPVPAARGVADATYLSKRACQGTVIRKTFIEVASAPQSVGSSYRRSQSAPCRARVDLELDDSQEWKPELAPMSSESMCWPLRSEGSCLRLHEPAKCVLRLSQFL